MAEEKEYRVVDEGNEIIRAIKARYPLHFQQVVPEQVIVLGITNMPRPFSMRKLAKIHKIDAAHKAMFKAFGGKDLRFYVELYCTDWVQWNAPRRQWILAHEIGHINVPSAKGLIQHDIEDFGWLLDAVGIDWWTKDDLPNLLEGEPFPFRLELFERLRSRESNEDNLGSDMACSPSDIQPFERVLVPNFSNSEPNLTSTRQRNIDGKCCFHGCDNPLPKEEYPYMGFLACEKCGKKLQAEMRKAQEEAFVEAMRYVISATT